MLHSWKLLAFAAVVLLSLLGTQFAAACPFCASPSLTLAEQVAQSDATALVQWVSGTKAVEGTEGSTVFEVKQIVRNYKGSLKVGDKLTLPRYRASKVGDLSLVLGTQTGKANNLEWGSPLEVTEASFNYIAQAPSPETPVAKRLEYYAKFLEFSDELVSNDAYGEFANAPYADIALISNKLPRDKIRKWVMSPETPATRLGLYGLLIGLCGTPDDAKLVEAKITAATDDYRLGIDGLISGYLLLTGTKGLTIIDETKLRNRDVKFSETYAAMSAVRFMWQYGDGRIEKERLRESMRILLDRPELADLVIADLCRWNDWSIQDRLMKMYGEGEFNIPSMKRAIVRYMLVASKDVPKEAVAGDNSKLPEHVEKARKYLAELRVKDEKTVAEAELYFLPNNR